MTPALLPKTLLDWLRHNEIDPDLIEDALETATLEEFPLKSGKKERKPVWLLRTSVSLLLASANSAHQGTLSTWLLKDANLHFSSGLLRDQVVVENQTLDLPLRTGKKARIFVQEALGNAPEHKTSRSIAPKKEEPSKPPKSDALWMQALPKAHKNALHDILHDNEHLLGIAETGTDDPAPVWFVLTDLRAGVLSLPEPPTASLWRDLPVGPELRCETRVTRDLFHVGEETWFQGPVVGASSLRRLFALASLDTPTRLIQAARDHLKHKKYTRALLLLNRALESCDTATSGIAHLHRAEAHHRLDAEEEALKALIQAALSRPQDDFLQATDTLGLLKDLTWLQTLALARESVGQHASALPVYQQLRKLDPKQDLYVLQHARALAQARRYPEASDTYDLFVQGRTVLAGLSLTQDTENPEFAGCDMALVEALRELGNLHKAHQNVPLAIRAYLGLIREAPFSLQGYEHLFALDSPDSPHRESIERAGQVLQLLLPEAFKRLQKEHKIFPSGLHRRQEPPQHYNPLLEGEHQTGLLHQEEKERSNLTQKWLGNLLSESRETQDIERHCQKISASEHPEHKAILSRLSHLLNIPTPRCFLSHGTTGIEALGQGDTPFILLGATHLQKGHERYLHPLHFTFAAASQMEHIRAQHLILTSSEFWKAFGNRTLDASMTVLSVIPAASWLGKFADTFALKWLAEVQKKIESQTLLKAFQMAKTRLEGGFVGDQLQSAMGVALDKMKSPEPVTTDSLIKNKLANFARGALYTADRAGLLACDDLTSAVEAILLLSPTAIEELPALRNYGLAHVLSRRNPEGEIFYRELALRLGELFRFALSEEYESLRRSCVATASST